MNEVEQLEFELYQALESLAYINRLSLDEMDKALDTWIAKAEQGDTGGK